MASHYALLGVPQDACIDVIKAAYRREARRCHPDVGGDPARMAALNEAWRVLGDPERRAAHDRELAFGRPSPPPCPDGKPVLDFGRYAGWPIDAVAAVDDDYLAWLIRTPAGRPLQAVISRVLAERRQALDALAPQRPPRPSWAR